MNAARWLSLLLAAPPTLGFYLPGVAPHEYLDGEAVEIKVNQLSSPRTHLPFDYYALPHCRPETLESKAENLGEVLHGSKIQNSPFALQMGKTAFRVLCRVELTAHDAAVFGARIAQDYRVQMIMDNLPAATRILTDSDGIALTTYERGYPLGFLGSPEFPGTFPSAPYINNHLRLIIKYHQEPDLFQGSRIVGFEVEALSVAHRYEGEWRGVATKLATVPLSPDLPPQPVRAEHRCRRRQGGGSAAGGCEVIFTYEVTWEESPVRWASRWDLYLYMGDDQVHWISLVNSLAVVLLLTGVVAMIMARTLRRDLNRYNSLSDVADEREELLEESGWKLVHADVLRPPPRPLLLSVSVGTGVQLLCMSFISIACALLGFLSPANRGGLLTATLLLFVLMGVPAGYGASRTFKSLRGVEWRALTLLTATAYPAAMLLNLALWSHGSTGAVPAGTFVALLAMWFCVSLPLVFVGAFLGFKRPLPAPPTRTNEIPRQIPPQGWFLGRAVTMARFYYVFGFLALVLLLLVITCAEISIVLCYFQLCAEDHAWWWRAFLNSGAAGLYLLAYSGIYYCTQLEISGFVPLLLYVGYMALASLLFFLITGTVGFLACWWFVWTIFGSVKVD
ncbi:hypothetical protein EMIHUDRAFT_470908 [Emiliania huxleyi CCMP1516]|uniref:Transmembrane 9 superfamily member n=2 Tax=Emiliania huxleyi TaxID=2903 RepID=A0A0D3IJN0_EMIH1|nr:hypothetical protein EMIHUDRAFT_470908 [Emiliania huxleyi CCMP1516]EOD11465.1 hypothetical protein EMIHUDRAFT_470908 [Emiliania huxleyi CCMP1516]|eukprot:XP_005763894.1 hypothetical protein EMIHUDRAFT_470908 [Emiliania huxleyi CCMP1516]